MSVTDKICQKKITKVIFWFLFFFIFVPYFFIDFCNFFDETLFIYIICAFLAFSCWILYLYWKKQQSNWKASTIYNCVTWLFFGIFITKLMTIYLRLLKIYNVDIYRDLLNSTLWALKDLPEMIPLIYMFSVIVGRLIGKDDNIT
jgi:hypothetical protein